MKSSASPLRSNVRPRRLGPSLQRTSHFPFGLRWRSTQSAPFDRAKTRKAALLRRSVACARSVRFEPRRRWAWPSSYRRPQPSLVLADGDPILARDWLKGVEVSATDRSQDGVIAEARTLSYLSRCQNVTGAAA